MEQEDEYSHEDTCKQHVCAQFLYRHIFLPSATKIYWNLEEEMSLIDGKVLCSWIDIRGRQAVIE